MPVITEEQLLNMSEDDYMNDQQLEFFEHLIRQQKAEIMEEIEDAKKNLGAPPESSDEADRAQYEEESALLIRLIDRKRRLLPKYDQALQRIRNDEFGFCEETGEPIGLKRLLIRPIAEYSIDAKTVNEIKEKHYI